jgi:hypothetical protein
MRWAGHVVRKGRRGMHIGYWWESKKESDYYEDQDLGGWTMLKLILERWDGMDWIVLAQDTDQWKGLVNKVMNLRAP